MGFVCSKRPMSTEIQSDGRTICFQDSHKNSKKGRTFRHFICFDIGGNRTGSLHDNTPRLNTPRSVRSTSRIVIGTKRKKRRAKKKRKRNSNANLSEFQNQLAPSSKSIIPKEDINRGNTDVSVPCVGNIIHCLNDIRLSKELHDTEKPKNVDLLVHYEGYVIKCLNRQRLTKAPKEKEEAEYTGRDDVLIKCDGYTLHCKNDIRLSKTINREEEAEDKDSRKIMNERGKLAETIKQMNNKRFSENAVKIFKHCVRNGYGLCCRFLMMCNPFIRSKHGLVRAVKKSITLSMKTEVATLKAGHTDTAKAIAWQITRAFYKNQNDQRIFKYIYPTFKCVCETKVATDYFCSDVLCIVVEVAKYIPSLPITYKSIQIYQKYTDDICTEGECIKLRQENSLQAQSCSVSLSHGVSSQFAHQCFNKHSNLVSIVPSFVRSKHFKTNMHQVTTERCITFTCRLKGFIPIGERHFPFAVESLDEGTIPTDIIEGNINFSNLMVGNPIESSTMSGTLGGVLIYYNRSCFITCAHVLLDEQSMISRKTNPIHKKDLRVFVKDEHGQRIECGNALRCDFETGSDTKPGIDVAIIEMNAQCTVNPNSMVLDKAKNPHSHIYLGMSNEFLNDNCIDYELLTLTHSEVQTMAFGQVTTVENCKTEFEPERMIEVELKSLGQAVAVANGNPTFPVMIAQPAHFQMSQGSLPATTTFRMYNQLCLNIPLVPGDSGTCIYIRNCPYSNANEKCKLSDKNGKCPHSGCLGMAIAFSNGMSIVTPLKKIFEHIL